ncbi:MAG: hypothetical protein AB7N61_23145 [Acidimicrobiia bacterium]
MTATLPPQIDELTQAAKKLATEGLYLGVGFGVLAAREINIRRGEISKVVNDVQEMLPPTLRSASEQLSEIAVQLIKVGESAGREVLHRINLD